MPCERMPICCYIFKYWLPYLLGIHVYDKYFFKDKITYVYDILAYLFTDKSEAPMFFLKKIKEESGNYKN